MKIKKAVGLYFSLWVLLLPFQSCRDKSDLLTQTWVMQEMKYASGISPELQQYVQETNSKTKDVFRIVYRQDGTYETTQQTPLEKGTWKLNWNSTKITTKNSKGELNDYRIRKLTKEELEFATTVGKSELILVLKSEKL